MIEPDLTVGSSLIKINKTILDKEKHKRAILSIVSDVSLVIKFSNEKTENSFLIDYTTSAKKAYIKIPRLKYDIALGIWYANSQYEGTLYFNRNKH